MVVIAIFEIPFCSNYIKKPTINYLISTILVNFPRKGEFNFLERIKTPLE